jgi:hypothetical protein
VTKKEVDGMRDPLSENDGFKKLGAGHRYYNQALHLHFALKGQE